MVLSGKETSQKNPALYRIREFFRAECAALKHSYSIRLPIESKPECLHTSV